MEVNKIMEIIYRAIRDEEDGNLEPNCIGIGCLDTDKSTLYLEIEKKLKEQS